MKCSFSAYPMMEFCHGKLITAVYLSCPENSIPAEFPSCKTVIICSLPDTHCTYRIITQHNKSLAILCY